MFKVNNKDTRTTQDNVLVLTINFVFTPCSSISIVNVEHVNAGWVQLKL